MRYALSFSGGKDSTLALDRAMASGLDVATLFTIHDGPSNRVRFHGVRVPLIEAQAGAFGLPLVLDATNGTGYEAVFERMLDRLYAEGIGGIVFGNIHLADIRAWYEERVRRRGLEYVEPLWSEDPAALVRAFVERGYQATVTSVDPTRAPDTWLGRSLDGGLLREILEEHPEIDPCGERGEYHTFVTNGPLFQMPVLVERGERIDADGHAMIDLVAADV